MLILFKNKTNYPVVHIIKARIDAQGQRSKGIRTRYSQTINHAPTIRCGVLILYTTGCIVIVVILIAMESNILRMNANCRLLQNIYQIYKRLTAHTISLIYSIIFIRLGVLFEDENNKHWCIKIGTNLMYL